MTLVLDTLRDSLGQDDGTRRWCVAFSGGLDSMALLHGLHELQQELQGIELRAVHINHGLHPDANAWARECEAIAGRIDVPLRVQRVEVDRRSGEGLEASARRARYAAFGSMLAPNELLMTGHHAEDQVETLLLRLMRGAGVRGLGSIVARTRFGWAWLVRPLLSIGRSDLDAYARAQGLSWIEDPSNSDIGIDRNYLRHQVVPALRQRWPGLEAAIGRSARLAAEAATLLHELGGQDYVSVEDNDRLSLERLRDLDPARQRNLIRYVLHERGIVPPSEKQMLTGLDQLLSARADRQPVLRWPDGQIRRYRGHLYVLSTDPELATAGLPTEYTWDGCAPLDLGVVRGRLQLASDDPEDKIPGHLIVSFRSGGERMLEVNHRHHQQLKKMLQARGIVPWMRGHLPLVTLDGELLAVGDLWLSAAFAARVGPSFRVVWDRHARIR